MIRFIDTDLGLEMGESSVLSEADLGGEGGDLEGRRLVVLSEDVFLFLSKNISTAFRLSSAKVAASTVFLLVRVFRTCIAISLAKSSTLFFFNFDKFALR
jgi:hypothetical protein